MQSLAECGLAGWVIIALAIVLVPVSATALVFAIGRRRAGVAFALLALSLGLAPFGCGVVGERLGRSKVDEILPLVDAGVREELRAVGYAEAAQCKKVGLGGMALPAGLAAVALALALVRRPTAAKAAPPR